jgi:hypothetical protein
VLHDLEKDRDLELYEAATNARSAIRAALQALVDARRMARIAANAAAAL